MNPTPTIPEFFSHQHIFITGATGFMGKVLIEKLLRSCPNLERIYILVRGKKNKSGQERWKEATKVPIFDKLNEQHPGIIDSKVEVLNGDVREKKLGLSDEDWHKLQENVSILFHCAASVRFNDPLSEAVFMNLRGSHEVLKLALGMSKLKVLVHISTTYCNSYTTESDETRYPFPADWRKTIEIAEKLDPRAVATLAPKYLGVFPNTYTFTKNLAEQMVWEYREKLPIVIIRPSIVICSLNDPIPGWIDNLYGPMGLMLGTGKGVVRVSCADNDAMPDYMAVDVAIKAIIIAAWKKGVNPTTGDVSIYNVASRSKGITNGEMARIALSICYQYPTNQMLWYPCHRIIKNRTWFKCEAILKHLMPAVLVDFLFKMSGKKPINLLEIQIRVYNAMLALGYFATKKWIFKNDNFLGLRNVILDADKEDFYFDLENVDVKEFIEMGIIMGKKYMLNEDQNFLDSARSKLNRFYWLDKITNVAIKSLMGLAAYKYFF